MKNPFQINFLSSSSVQQKAPALWLGDLHKGITELLSSGSFQPEGVKKNSWQQQGSSRAVEAKHLQVQILQSCSVFYAVETVDIFFCLGDVFVLVYSRHFMTICSPLLFPPARPPPMHPYYTISLLFTCFVFWAIPSSVKNSIFS